MITIEQKQTRNAKDLIDELTTNFPPDELINYLLDNSHNKLIASNYLGEPIESLDQHIAISRQLHVFFEALKKT